MLLIGRQEGMRCRLAYRKKHQERKLKKPCHPNCGLLISYKGKKYSSSQTASPLRELMCHMGSHSVTCHPAEVTFAPLPQPIKAGTRFSDPGGMQGWVDLVGLVTYRCGTPARRRSPIPVLTGLNVEQLRSCDERRYRYAKPANQYLDTNYICYNSHTTILQLSGLCLG